jgi:hypothetical protein
MTTTNTSTTQQWEYGSNNSKQQQQADSDLAGFYALSFAVRASSVCYACAMPVQASSVCYACECMCACVRVCVLCACMRVIVGWVYWALSLSFSLNVSIGTNLHSRDKPPARGQASFNAYHSVLACKPPPTPTTVCSPARGQASSNASTQGTSLL